MLKNIMARRNDASQANWQEVKEDFERRSTNIVVEKQTKEKRPGMVVRGYVMNDPGQYGRHKLFITSPFREKDFEQSGRMVSGTTAAVDVWESHFLSEEEKKQPGVHERRKWSVWELRDEKKEISLYDLLEVKSMDGTWKLGFSNKVAPGSAVTLTNLRYERKFKDGAVYVENFQGDLVETFRPVGFESLEQMCTIYPMLIQMVNLQLGEDAPPFSPTLLQKIAAIEAEPEPEEADAKRKRKYKLIDLKEQLQLSRLDDLQRSFYQKIIAIPVAGTATATLASKLGLTWAPATSKVTETKSQKDTSYAKGGFTALVMQVRGQKTERVAVAASLTAAVFAQFGMKCAPIMPTLFPILFNAARGVVWAIPEAKASGEQREVHSDDDGAVYDYTVFTRPVFAQLDAVEMIFRAAIPITVDYAEELWKGQLWSDLRKVYADEADPWAGRSDIKNMSENLTSPKMMNYQYFVVNPCLSRNTVQSVLKLMKNGLSVKELSDAVSDHFMKKTRKNGPKLDFLDNNFDFNDKKLPVVFGVHPDRMADYVGFLQTDGVAIYDEEEIYADYVKFLEKAESVTGAPVNADEPQFQVPAAVAAPVPAPVEEEPAARPVSAPKRRKVSLQEE